MQEIFKMIWILELSSYFNLLIDLVPDVSTLIKLQLKVIVCWTKSFLRYGFYNQIYVFNPVFFSDFYNLKTESVENCKAG